MSIKQFRDYTNMDRLQEYKNSGLEILLVYSRLGKLIPNDLVGAHFIMGKLLNVTNGHIIFDGPNGITAQGVIYPGSPYEITKDNAILAVPIKDIELNMLEAELFQYQFNTMYDVKLGEPILAPNSLIGCIILANNNTFMMAERSRGYTTPVRLEKIITMPREKKISLNVERSNSEISRLMKVNKSCSGTGNAIYR